MEPGRQRFWIPACAGMTAWGPKGHRSDSISAAVAFALPTTPGIPAPGWVPAPTKYRFGIWSSRLWTRK